MTCRNGPFYEFAYWRLDARVTSLQLIILFKFDKWILNQILEGKKAYACAMRFFLETLDLCPLAISFDHTMFWIPIRRCSYLHCIDCTQVAWVECYIGKV